MSEEIKVLDHGYVRLVESWGSDERIIEAARMSTQKGFEGWGPHFGNCVECGVDPETFDSRGGWDNLPCIVGRVAHAWKETPGDEKLLAYLWKNHHATPFEMAGLVIEVQAPIFVFREWHRHRTQSYNEMSARYAPLPDLNYVPTVERLMRDAGKNKQAGSTGAVLTEANAWAFLDILDKSYAAAQRDYELALNVGVPKELARLVLPVGRYSRMRAQANLRNWLAFLTLRADSKAQWEIQQYANAVSTVIADKFPRTHALWSGVAA